MIAAGYPRSVPSACRADTPAPGDGQPTEPAGHRKIIYSPRSDRYTYAWKADRHWSGCRQLIVCLTDNTTHRATFRFTR